MSQSVKSRVLNSELVAELRTNVRLQYMLLAVVAILAVSLVKLVNDVKSEMESGLEREQQAFARLSRASQQELSPEQVEASRREVVNVLNSLPLSQSLSVAEATALSRVETLASGRILNGRATLVGSETISVSSSEFWQVRVEYQGQMNPSNFFEYLAAVDGNDSSLRLVSFRYRPQRSGGVSFVMDYMFRAQSPS